MNKCVFMGRLVKDVELKYTGNNLALGKFCIAVNRKFTKQGEEKKADFINCTAFGKNAENISIWFQKGDLIALVGRIEINPFDAEDGKRTYFTNLIVDEWEFAGSVKKQSQENNQTDSTNNQQQNNQGEFYPVNEDDDELPF